MVVNRFSLPNANSVILAQSGAGKSYTAKLEILRSFAQGCQIIVIDPENEYQKLCQSLGGNYYKVDQSSQLKLNPLSLKLKSASSLQPKLAFVMQILKVMLGSLKPSQLATLDQALFKIYLKNPSPQLDDLYQYLQKQKHFKLAQLLRPYIEGHLSNLFGKDQIDLQSQLTVFGLKDLNFQLRPLLIIIIANLVYQEVLENP